MADSEETPGEVEAVADSSAAPQASGGWRVLGRPGLFAAIFGVALLASWIYREQAREQDGPQPGESGVALVNAPDHVEKKAEAPAGALECLASGDEALQRHAYQRA